MPVPRPPDGVRSYAGRRMVAKPREIHPSSGCKAGSHRRHRRHPALASGHSGGGASRRPEYRRTTMRKIALALAASGAALAGLGMVSAVADDSSYRAAVTDIEQTIGFVPTF